MSFANPSDQAYRAKCRLKRAVHVQRCVANRGERSPAGGGRLCGVARLDRPKLQLDVRGEGSEVRVGSAGHFRNQHACSHTGGWSGDGSPVFPACVFHVGVRRGFQGLSRASAGGLGTIAINFRFKSDASSSSSHSSSWNLSTWGVGLLSTGSSEACAPFLLISKSAPRSHLPGRFRRDPGGDGVGPN